MYITKVIERMDKKIIEKYFERIKNGPTIICICCGGLWFKHQTKNKLKSFIDSKFTSEFITRVICVEFLKQENTYYFCNTCYQHIINEKVPSLSLWNGLDFPKKPEFLTEPTSVEERFFSPRIPFLQIKSLGHEKQFGLRGQVVNVPIQVNTVVHTLPRSMNETHTIQLHIKRKMQYKHDYMCEVIRPGLIYKWVKYLDGCELYRNLGIKINEEWKHFDEKCTIPYLVDYRENEKNDLMELYGTFTVFF